MRPNFRNAFQQIPQTTSFLACAMAACAPTIVSGDKHLLRLNGWSELLILTPRQFVDRHNEWFGAQPEGR